jgi:hypothetical protein
MFASGKKVKSGPVKKRIKKVEVEADDGDVKEEEVKVEKDDVGIKIEADLEDEGKVEIQSIAGAPGAHAESADDK